jgi:superfamily II DNA or RNA helicase
MQLREWNRTLREWQGEAFEKARAKYETRRDFLCVATPGAGKTIFALRVAHELLSAGKVARVVVVCPTEHLKRQWAEAAGAVGIALDPFFENSARRETADYLGASLTYAQVGRAPNVHAANCRAKPTLAVFDEIHHLGDNLTWGNAGVSAFEDAAYRLAISGTPFRRDNNPIPFVDYVDGKSAADFNYSYSRAINERVCRPVYFPAYEGEMEYRLDDQVYTATFAEPLDRAHDAARLRTALDPEGKWLETVVRDADRKLGDVRAAGETDAGGLLIAIDQAHARACASLVHFVSGEKPVVVVSDDPSASKKIKEFAKGTDRWLVAVKMVSEGVDVPRLQVGVYATNVKSELFFRQAVGRFVRRRPNAKERRAFFYLPQDFRLVGFAREIEEERDHVLEPPPATEDLFEEVPELEETERERDEDRFEAISSYATDRVQLELDFGAEFRSPDEKTKPPEAEMIDPREPSEPETPKFERVENIKKEINDLARRFALKRRQGGRVDWHLAHKLWISVGGKAIDEETYDELAQRKTWLIRQFKSNA